MRFTPRDTAFYDMFAASADNIVEAVRLLAQALPEDAPRATIADQLRAVEHAGDDITHALIRRVNSTFVTPFDREDIYALASTLDDVLDEIEAAVDQMVLYRVQALTPEFVELVDVLQRMAELTATAMPRLRTMGHLREYWVEINRLENMADQIYRRLLARLFSGEFKALVVLKLKDIADALERATDDFEHVAHIVETIALKEA